MSTEKLDIQGAAKEGLPAISYKESVQVKHQRTQPKDDAGGPDRKFTVLPDRDELPEIDGYQVQADKAAGQQTQSPKELFADKDAREQKRFAADQPQEGDIVSRIAEGYRGQHECGAKHRQHNEGFAALPGDGKLSTAELDRANDQERQERQLWLYRLKLHRAQQQQSIQQRGR